ncbi:MAG TPA: tetratricopeptide repeat protein [Baekduia sp.]|nr:tetratricopeptide repeat protein [Baekduia sp.]
MNDVVPLLKFTPSAQDPALLEAITVQREPLIDGVVKAITDTKGGARHQLLVGPRGMGKTHVLSLVVSRVRQREVDDDVVLAWLIEDPWAIRTYGKLLAEIAAAVAAETGDDTLSRAATALRSGGDRDQEVAVEDALKAAVGKRRLVLLMENLDDTFRRISTNGQDKLRALAEDWRQLLIIATTPQLFAGVQRHQSPFYGFFNITHLDELRLDNAIELLRKVAEVRRDRDLLEFLDTDAARRRLAAVEALAGGHPRVWLLLAGCISVPAIDQLVPLFLEALDDLTPYYQDRLRELGDQQQELVVMLCEAGGARTNRALAQSSGIAPNQVASILRTLADRGYVRHAVLPDNLSAGDRRRTHWELREPLMRLCLDVKRSRGEPLRIVVEFLREWYGARLLDETVGLSSDASLAMSYVSAALREMEPSLDSRELLRGTAEEALTRAEHGLALLPDSTTLKLARAKALVMTHRYEDAQLVVDRVLTEDPGLELTARLGIAALRWEAIVAGESPGADARIHQALTDMQALDPDARNLLLEGFVIYLLGLPDEGSGRLRHALTVGPEDASMANYLGVALERVDHLDDALGAYTRAVDLAPDVVVYRVDLAALLTRRKEFAAALEQLQAAERLEPNDVQLMLLTGYCLNRMGRHEQALEQFGRCIELASDSDAAWSGSGMSLGYLARWDEAVAAFDQAIALAEDEPSNYVVRSAVFLKTARYTEAVADAERAVILEPENPYWKRGLGRALDGRATKLRRSQRFDDAERDARAAAALAPGEATHRFTLAEILFDARADDAGAASLNEALDIWRSKPGPFPGRLATLCGILLRRFADDEGPSLKALEAFDRAGALEPLGQGLVASLDVALDAKAPVEIVDRWLAFWQRAAAHPPRPELAIPTAMMAAAVAWKRDGDEAHLLALPAEQRTILVELIGQLPAH